ncbi:MAG: hypothetical protein ACOCXF_02900 [bacterium]
MSSMNSDQIKSLLLQVEPCDEYFSVVLSGKESKKVNGLYKPEEQEIVLHNKNFKNENLLIYTALHEYAHHLHYCSPEPPKSTRAHTRRYWSIFHSLLNKAEQQGVYINIFEQDTRFVELTRDIRSRFITPHGNLMQEFGRTLQRAQELCEETGARFEDYVDRVLQLDRREMKRMVQVSGSGLPADIGYDNMKALAQLKTAEEQQEALRALQSGYSQDMLKEEFTAARKNRAEEDPVDQLAKEKQRIVKTIEKLTRRLEEIDQELSSS